jgi:hypothetical protein
VQELTVVRSRNPPSGNGQTATDLAKRVRYSVSEALFAFGQRFPIPDSYVLAATTQIFATRNATMSLDKYDLARHMLSIAGT